MTLPEYPTIDESSAEACSMTNISESKTAETEKQREDGCAVASSDLLAGDIVQLHPEKCRNPMFAACLMVVTELKSWGAQGYVQGLGENGKQVGQAYYRATWEEMERTGGKAPWVAN